MKENAETKLTWEMISTVVGLVLRLPTDTEKNSDTFGNAFQKKKRTPVMTMV